jgi:shikimate kinase
MQTTKTIVITGFMAAGKSTAAARLAVDSGWQLICLDQQIEERFGRSIAQIFAENGEAEFRKVESSLLKEAVTARVSPAIIDAGGGVVILEQNRKMLEQACVIFLDACFDEIIKRLDRAEVDRPLLHELDKEAIRQLWEARRELYIKTADFVVKDIAELIALFDRLLQRG